jgi:hypothetical protein
VHAGAEAFFDGSNGTLDLTDVTVRGDDVDVGGVNVIANAGKFVVAVDRSDIETT